MKGNWFKCSGTTWEPQRLKPTMQTGGTLASLSSFTSPWAETVLSEKERKKESLCKLRTTTAVIFKPCQSVWTTVVWTEVAIHQPDYAGRQCSCLAVRLALFHTQNLSVCNRSVHSPGNHRFFSLL